MFNTATPMPGFGRLFAMAGAAAIGLAALSFTGGVLIERHLWENSNMGDLCAKGVHPWACALHPNCTMQSLHCFDNFNTPLEEPKE